MRLLTTDQVCRMLQISRVTLYRLVKKGEIEQLHLTPRTVRFSEKEIIRFVHGDNDDSAKEDLKQ